MTSSSPRRRREKVDVARRDAGDVVAQAFAELAGRRTAPICSTDDDAANEYALELTIGGETVTIPDDTALDVGGYRVLVERARSIEATADTPVAQFFDAIVMRTTG